MKQNRDTQIGERARATVAARAAADAAKRARKNKTMSSDSSTGGSDTVPETPERNEFRKEMMRRNATPGMKKGGKMKKYAAGGVTKEMPSSKAMGSLGMAKGGKAKAKGKDKGNPFAATKFGTAMMKKSADTKGRAMKKFAVGGPTSSAKPAAKTAFTRFDDASPEVQQQRLAYSRSPVGIAARKALTQQTQARQQQQAQARQQQTAVQKAVQTPAATAVQKPAATAVQKSVMQVRKGGKIEKKAKGGSIDGCAVKGKTKAKRVTMARGGMAGYKKGGKTC